MSDVRDANPGDVFVDSIGRLYRVVKFTCHEPTVHMEAIEKLSTDGNEFLSDRLHGGVSGLMWDGFKRIYPTKEETK
jgi:hypothetical protein